MSEPQNAVLVPEEEASGASMPLALLPVFPYPPPRNNSGCYAKKFITQLELSGGSHSGRVATWVDSMKAASPTATTTIIPYDGDQECQAWFTQHPSAVDKFEKIVMAAAKTKQIVVFLDYDGTLSPIVNDPDRAFMSDRMRDAVRDVAEFFPTAIVSGRAIDKVYNFVQLPELYYAGSHGMDIKGPTKGTKQTKDVKTVLFQPASEFLPAIDKIYKALMDKTLSIPGTKVENNKFCVSVHFRCVDEKMWSTLAGRVRSVLKDYPKLRLTQGRKVLEIRPVIKWDKGKAIEFLLETLGFANCDDVLPIYIGDDRTDEDDFKVLRDRKQGFGILVSKFPKETSAFYSLRDPMEVMNFLHRLVEWRRFSDEGSIKGVNTIEC